MPCAASLSVPAHILHLLPDGCLAGARRTAQLIDTLGSGYRHCIVAGRPEERGWLARAQHDDPRFISGFPRLTGAPLPGRLQRIARAMLPFDLVVTHGYEAMNAVMARTMFSEGLAPPPLIHHEWEDELALNGFTRRKRDLYRQLALGRSAGLVVPDEMLEGRALIHWQQPLGRVKRISDAVDVRTFAKRPKADSLPGIIKRPGELWIGVVDDGGKGAGLTDALAAIGTLPDSAMLIWASANDQQSAVREAANAAGLNDRVYPLSKMPDFHRFLGLFDIALVPSGSPWPHEAALGAVAAGVPFVAGDAGALAEFTAPENAPFLNAPIAQSLRQLTARPDLRREIGEANRRTALAKFDLKNLAATYRRLFDSAIAQTPRKR